MASVRRVVTYCNRCGFGSELPATTERTFSIEDAHYKLDLCEEHGKLFDREMGRWSMVADDVEAPTIRHRSEYFTSERVREAKRIAELRAKVAEQAASKEFAQRRALEIEAESAVKEEAHARHSIPGAMAWGLTTHARERMVERGFTISEVLQTVAHPAAIVEQPWRGPFIEVRQRGDCRVAVNAQEKAIITVIDRSDVLETEPQFQSPEKKAMTR